MQKRVASNECSELRTAVTERKNRIRQLQARYDVALFGATTDGTPMSTAYLKIQNAQERYLLRERGDKLDESIRRTEQEIRSMENTLRVVNVCNDKYKDSLSAVDQDGPEQTEQRQLDEQIHAARQKLRQRQSQLQQLHDRLQVWGEFLESKKQFLVKRKDKAKLTRKMEMEFIRGKVKEMMQGI